MRWTLLAAVLALAACNKTVKTKEFEADVKKRLGEIGFPDASVACAKDVKAEKGKEFTCDVGIEGKTYVLVVTITNVDGSRVDMDTKWKDGEAIVTARLEPPFANQLTSSLGVPVTVECGDALRFLAADRSVACDITAATAKAKLTITFDDKLEPNGTKIDPQLISKAKVEEFLVPSIKEKTGVDTKVTCGADPVMPRPADGVFRCDVEGGPSPAKVKVTVDDTLEKIEWVIEALDAPK
jgi:hypothetical protein